MEKAPLRNNKVLHEKKKPGSEEEWEGTKKNGWDGLSVGAVQVNGTINDRAQLGRPTVKDEPPTNRQRT